MSLKNEDLFYFFIGVKKSLLGMRYIIHYMYTKYNTLLQTRRK